MAANGKKLYVGCSLTAASEEFKQSVDNLKSKLREQGYEVLEFIGLVKGTPKDVYEWDLQECVGKCDAFVAICDDPSIGLGFEMARALELGKPTLAVAHNDAKVTRLVLGAAEVEPTVTFKRYSDLVADVPGMIAALARD